MSKLIPAVQLFTLREYTQTPEGLENCFRRIRREIGCDTVQISCIGREIPASFLASLCREYDMKICVTHAPPDLVFSGDVGVYRRLIREHQSYGCDILGVGNSIPRYIDDGYEGFQRMLRDLAPLLRELKENGMKFAYHSHTYEFVKDPRTGRYIYDMLVEDTDPEVFHFIQDSFWMRYGGINHQKYLEKVAGRMEVLHVKDSTPRQSFCGTAEPYFGTIGEGNIFYPPILDMCKKTGVQYLAIEQDYCQRDPFLCLKDAMDALKKLIADAEKTEENEHE